MSELGEEGREGDEEDSRREEDTGGEESWSKADEERGST